MPVSLETLLAHVEQLAPTLTANARQLEEAGLDLTTVELLADAGLFKMLQPLRWGGYELAFSDHIELCRKLAGSAPAAAWLVAGFTAAAARIARMPEQAQQDVWRYTPEARITARDIPADGQCALRPAPGGFLLDGSWNFVPGAGFADWLLLGCNDPALGPVLTLLPRPEAQVTSLPRLGGLGAAGLSTVQVEQRFVPEHRVISRAALYGASAGGECSTFAALVDSGVIGPILGCAEGADREYTEATRRRMSGVTGESVAKLRQVQIRLAAAKGELKAATLLFDGLQNVFRAIEQDGQAVSYDQRLEMGRDRAVLARQSLQAVTQLVRQMGAMGLAESNPVQRRYRDIRAMATDYRVHYDDLLAAYGQNALGVSPDQGDPAAAWKVAI